MNRLSVLRVARRDRYAIVDQRTIRDPRLKNGPLGLLLRLLDRPDGWRTTVERLAIECGEGEYAINSALKALERLGYLTRSKYRDEAGQWRSEWVVREVPEEDTTRENRVRPDAKTATGPDAKTASLKKEVSTERRKDETSLPSVDEFAAWYAVYPRHEAPGAARRAFVKARSKVSLDVLVAGAQRYREDPNREKQFTKHPSTWLNGECWDDDPLPSKSKPESPGMKMIRRAAALTNGAQHGNGTDDPGSPRAALGALPSQRERR